MRKKFKIVVLFISVFSIAFWSCDTNKTKESTEKNPEDVVVEKPNVAVPTFNQDSAFLYVEEQVAFGPRVPNTAKHDQCAAYLINKLKSFGLSVIVQEAKVKAFDNSTLNIKNIIAELNPEATERILLTAHWDTRPWADQDIKEKNKPILGANDGGSGVGVLLEVARIISQNNPRVGVDIVLFDAEDYGQPDGTMIEQKSDTYCLGSQYWSKNLHKVNYRPIYGILLDMVGAKGATFTKEGNSVYYAPGIVSKVWAAANKIGYSNHFVNLNTGWITDDHLYINSLAGIPTIDILHHDLATQSNFGSYWHTHNDNMEAVDRNTLKAVGQTLLEVIYNE